MKNIGDLVEIVTNNDQEEIKNSVNSRVDIIITNAVAIKTMLADGTISIDDVKNLFFGSDSKKLTLITEKILVLEEVMTNDLKNSNISVNKPTGEELLMALDSLNKTLNLWVAPTEKRETAMLEEYKKYVYADFNIETNTTIPNLKEESRRR